MSSEATNSAAGSTTTTTTVDSTNNFTAITSLLADLIRNEGEHQTTTPTAKSFIDSLRTTRIGDHPSKLRSRGCPICTDDFAVEDDVNELPCGHLFHPKCIGPWLDRRNTCPMCRHELPPENPFPEFSIGLGNTEFSIGRRDALSRLRQRALRRQEGGSFALAARLRRLQREFPGAGHQTLVSLARARASDLQARESLARSAAVLEQRVSAGTATDGAELDMQTAASGAVTASAELDAQTTLSFARGRAELDTEPPLGTAAREALSRAIARAEEARISLARSVAALEQVMVTSVESMNSN